jgi:hypothetical protein
MVSPAEASIDRLLFQHPPRHLSARCPGKAIDGFPLTNPLVPRNPGLPFRSTRAVSSGAFQYPFITWGPRTTISPTRSVFPVAPNKAGDRAFGRPVILW